LFTGDVFTVSSKMDLAQIDLTQMDLAQIGEISCISNRRNAMKANL